MPTQSTDSTNLLGALDTASHPGNGTLPADATFDAEITDGAGGPDHDTHRRHGDP